MLTLDLRSKIDKLWNTFFANGIADPLTAIEQINYLIFMKRIDELDRQSLLKSQRVKSFTYESLFQGRITLGSQSYDRERMRWSHWSQMPAEEMFSFVKDVVFPWIKDLDDQSDFADNLKDAVFMIPNASLLVTAVTIIEALSITEQNEDTA